MCGATESIDIMAETYIHNYIYYIHTLISISSVGISKMFFIISFLSMSIVCHEGIFPGFTFILHFIFYEEEDCSGL